MGAADRSSIAGASLRVAGAALIPGAEVELGIRPERVRLATGPGDNTLAATVQGLVYQGAQTELTARLADGQRVLVFVAELAPFPLAIGQPLHLHLPADAFMPLA